MNVKKLARGMGIAVLSSALVAAGCGGSDSNATTPTSLVVRTATAGVATSSPVATAAGATSPSPTAAATGAAGATQAAPTALPAVQGTVATPAPQPTTAPRASAVALTFRAANLAFDKTAVSVPSGATVSATLQNDDAGIEHNLTFSLAGLPHGESCKGPCSTTQTFKADVPGSYFFLCTIHDMVGTFTVTP
ncbi:MAG: plastocyanin/azurin family copper-binding protein [bacterium]